MLILSPVPASLLFLGFIGIAALPYGEKEQAESLQGFSTLLKLPYWLCVQVLLTLQAQPTDEHVGSTV